MSPGDFQLEGYNSSSTKDLLEYFCVLRRVKFSYYHLLLKILHFGNKMNTPLHDSFSKY